MSDLVHAPAAARPRPAMTVGRAALWVALACVLWGSSGTAQRLGAGPLAPFWVGAAQLVVAGGFFQVLWHLRQRGAKTGLSRAAALPWPWVLGAALGTAGYSVTFYAGVRLTGVGVGTAVAIGSAPLWAGALQSLWARRVPASRWWMGMAVSVIGGALLVGVRPGAALPPVSWAGMGLCLLAGLSYAGYALLNQRLVQCAPTLQVNCWVFSTAAVLALPVAAWLAGPPQWALSSLLVVVYLGLVVSGLAYVLFSHGLRHLSGATGVALTLMEPVAAFVLAVVVLREPGPLGAWLGLLTVLAGLALVMQAEARTRGGSAG